MDVKAKGLNTLEEPVHPLLSGVRGWGLSCMDEREDGAARFRLWGNGH